MKKIITLLFFVSAYSFSYAQNSFDIYVDKDLSLSAITCMYSDRSEHDIALGAPGHYKIDTGDSTVDEITVNGTECPIGITEVFMDDNTPAVARRAVGRITFKAKEGATLAK